MGGSHWNVTGCHPGAGVTADMSAAQQEAAALGSQPRRDVAMAQGTPGVGTDELALLYRTV